MTTNTETLITQRNHYARLLRTAWRLELYGSPMRHPPGHVRRLRLEYMRSTNAVETATHRDVPLSPEGLRAWESIMAGIFAESGPRGPQEAL